MARINYGFDHKYFFTGTIRRDGFSGFSQKNKFGLFPSVSVAWVASEEGFLADNFDWLNNFHNRKLNILPGDSIRAMVHTEVKYGYDNDVVATHYSVTQVIEHLRVNNANQEDFFN